MEEGNNQLMISHNWDHQKLALAMRDLLESYGGYVVPDLVGINAKTQPGA